MSNQCCVRIPYHRKGTDHGLFSKFYSIVKLQSQAVMDNIFGICCGLLIILLTTPTTTFSQTSTGVNNNKRKIESTSHSQPLIFCKCKAVRSLFALIYDNNDVDVAGILITGGWNDDVLTTAEVYDVSTGGSCEVSQLPDMRFYHTEVIFDNIVSIYINIISLEWKYGLWWRYYS